MASDNLTDKSVGETTLLRDSQTLGLGQFTGELRVGLKVVPQYRLRKTTTNTDRLASSDSPHTNILVRNGFH
jgi:hypothetical protein